MDFPCIFKKLYIWQIIITACKTHQNNCLCVNINITCSNCARREQEKTLPNSQWGEKEGERLEHKVLTTQDCRWCRLVDCPRHSWNTENDERSLDHVEGLVHLEPTIFSPLLWVIKLSVKVNVKVNDDIMEGRRGLNTKSWPRETCGLELLPSQQLKD